MFEIREDLTTDNILSKISDYDIFKFYCSPFKEVGRKFNSELRDDPVPSAVITNFNGKLWYKDFGESNKPIDCFGYVMRKFSSTFIQALGTINLDFNLGLRGYIEYPPSLNYIGLPDKESLIQSSNFNTIASIPKKITVTYRNWIQSDLKYWKNRYYLNIPRLEFFGIRPISSKVLVEDRVISLGFPSYAYYIDRELNVDIYKLYSPFGNYKWIGNCKNHHYLGYRQLPLKGNKLVITKSLKDVAVLSIFKIPAISPQSESQIISYDMYNDVSNRFKKLYVLYDNDRAGINGSEETVERFPDIKPIFIPKDSGEKDISDFIDRYRYKATESLVKKLVC